MYFSVTLVKSTIKNLFVLKFTFEYLSLLLLFTLPPLSNKALKVNLKHSY